MKRIPDFRYVFARKLVPLSIDDLNGVKAFLQQIGESADGIEGLYTTLEYEEDGSNSGWRAVAYPYSKFSAFWEHTPYYVQQERTSYELANANAREFLRQSVGKLAEVSSHARK